MPPLKHRRELRLDGEDLQPGQRGRSTLADGRDAAARADAGEDVVRGLRGSPGRFLRRSALVDFPGSPGLSNCIGSQAPGSRPTISRAFAMRTLRAQLARRQLEGGAVGGHQLASLDGEGLRHDQDQLVALDGGRREPARRRCCRDVGSTMMLPGRRTPRLSASSSSTCAMRSLIEPPGFCRSSLTQTSTAGVKELVDAELGGVADGFKDVVGLCHGYLLGLVLGRAPGPKVRPAQGFSTLASVATRRKLTHWTGRAVHAWRSMNQPEPAVRDTR